MRAKDILDKIEALLNREIDKKENPEITENETEINEVQNEEKSLSNKFKDLAFLALSFTVSVVKTPFNIIAQYLKDELITAIRNDAKLYALFVGIFGVMFVFFSVLWLFISIAVGLYFYDSGYPLFNSVIYSIIFQLISMLIVALVGYFASKKFKSLKLLKKINHYKNQ